MKNKLLSSVLISLAFPVCGNAVTITGDELNIGTGNTVLAGSKSGAIGQGNQAANSSLAVGSGSLVTGSYSFAAGSDSQIDALTYCSALIGYGGAITRSDSSVSVGYMSWMTRELGSFTAGIGNTITTSVDQDGSANILLGGNNLLDKAAVGAGNYVSGAILIGNSNRSSVGDAWVMGLDNIGQYRTVTLGTYAATVTDASLIVGTGTANVTRSNGLVVLKSGVVQIPGSLLIGESAEPALTTTTAATAGYLNKVSGSGATAASNARIAWGSNASASHTGSVAIGNSSSSSGVQSVAIGVSSTASAGHSFAFGNAASASGQYSQALGHLALASGMYSTALGNHSKATGENSIAMMNGESNGTGSISIMGGHANADYSTATMGATASGVGSTAISGYYTGHVSATASGAAATVIGGVSGLASGDFSFTGGYQTTTSASHSTAFGSRNLSRGPGFVPADTTSWVETEALFELGNGKPSLSPEVYSNAITTLKNGQTTLTNKFWVSTTPEVVPAATDASAGAALVVEGHTVLKGNTKLAGKVTMEEAQGDISMGIYE